MEESLIEYLKVKPSSDIYYFIQHGSSTMAFKDCRIVVKDALKMTDDVFVVPARFQGDDFERTVIAYAGSTSKCNTRCLTVSVFQKGCIGGFEPQALSWPPV